MGKTLSLKKKKKSRGRVLKKGQNEITLNQNIDCDLIKVAVDLFKWYTGCLRKEKESEIKTESSMSAWRCLDPCKVLWCMYYVKKTYSDRKNQRLKPVPPTDRQK